MPDTHTGIRLPPIESRPDPGYSSRHGAKIRAAVIHTAEGESFEGVVGYVQRTSNVSAHYVVAGEPRSPASRWARVARMVPESQKAWTALSANATTVNYELCGFARQTRAEWLGKRRVQLETVAALVADDVLEYGLPIRRGYPGILGHGDLDRHGFPQTHWDPGPGFPWDHFLGRVRHYVKQAKRGAQAKPDVEKTGCDPKTGRPYAAPKRIPRWAWKLHAWYLRKPKRRGPKPETPARVPQWFWQWRKWRLGIPVCGGERK